LRTQKLEFEKELPTGIEVGNVGLQAESKGLEEAEDEGLEDEGLQAESKELEAADERLETASKTT